MNTDTEQRIAAVDEQALIRRAREGDGEAFLHLYRLHAAHLYGVCLRILANETLARDAAQQALIDAWEHLTAYRFEAPFSAWIHRIAVHSALAVIRSEKRRGLRVEFSDQATMEEAPDRQAFGGETAIDLEQAVAMLPPRMRTVLVLHDIEGYRHEEIGTFLNIAPGTSKAHLHRARMLVKEWLQQ